VHHFQNGLPVGKIEAIFDPGSFFYQRSTWVQGIKKSQRHFANIDAGKKKKNFPPTLL
jgi:hypothetical protein